MGNSASNARRIAQTERTRLQSQARADQLHEAEAMGIRTTKTWTARMVNTRDSHAALNGKTVYENEKFTTIWGNELAYPGDPSAPAREVINCHCVMVPGVELPGDKKASAERLPKTAKSGIMKLDLQTFAEKDIEKQKTASLVKGIESFSKQIATHKAKIEHPEQFYSDWEQKTPAEKKGLEKHWKKEIDNFEKSVQNRIDELKKRGEYHD